MKYTQDIKSPILDKIAEKTIQDGTVMMSVPSLTELLDGKSCIGFVDKSKFIIPNSVKHGTL